MAGVSRIKSSILGRKGGFLHTYAMMESVQGSMTSGGSVPESLNSSNQATPVKIIPPTPHRKLRAKSQGGKQFSNLFCIFLNPNNFSQFELLLF